MNTPTQSQSYAAQITVSLPGSNQAATATLTLAPTDTVSLTGGSKRLQDCTLAELKQFAASWEAEIWETYEDVKIIDLVTDEVVDVHVKPQDKMADKPLTEWLNKAVIITPTSENKAVQTTDEVENVEEIPIIDATPAAEPSPPAVEMLSVVDAKPTGASSALDEQPLSPRITVAEPEPVHPEREALTSPVLPTPHILPSKARVRVAGRKKPLGARTWQAVDILLDEPALRASQAHALSSLNREVAGVLVGPPPEKQPDGRYLVHIIDTIVAKHTVMHGASVTYTPESWRYVNDKLAERYPDETAVMVGWYHTHPGFGIFLSGMDQFIHQNFFTQIWHVAYVLDPVARTSGFFCWDKQKTKVNKIDFDWPNWAPKSW